MGWLIYGHGERVDDPQAECDRLCTWSREDRSCRVLESALVGNTYFAAVEVTPRSAPQYVTAAVILIQRAPFGYKDMDESVGPYHDEACPRSILEKLSPLSDPEKADRYAAAWRARQLERHAQAA